MQIQIRWRSSSRRAQFVGFVLALPLIASLNACGDKIDPIQIGDGSCDIADPVVYEGVLDQVLSVHCVSCHGESVFGVSRRGAPTNVNLDSFEGARRWADRSFARVSDGSMPPPGTPRVTACEVSAFARWSELGEPRSEEDI